jgi:hypothetical protein
MAIPPVRSAGDSGHIQDHNDIRTELTTRLPLTGGTLTGTLNGTSAIFSGSVQAASGSFSGNVTAATPTSSGHVATKGYVDSNTSVSPIFSAYSGTIKWNGENVPGNVPLTPIHQRTTGLAANMTVTFPVGRFTQSPVVTICTGNPDDTLWGIYAQSYIMYVGPSSVTIGIYNVGPQNTSFTKATFHIHANQMTSGSGAG